ncbi:MAG: DNA polymerase III subunit gamma/tau [Alphaproteobacteria bacterium]|jgi:DNA polymerase III subunit gamma/tau|nr:DNA polymerase III subunit gamma/tau [Alphaproteobacteria bacterium]
MSNKKEEVKNENYKVLAIKYRPKNFEELKGQDVLVQTLTNAIEQEKIAHAYMMTGVRGVGKTSSARIFAKSLNCTGTDGKTEGPTIKPCGICENCKSIEAGSHIDVIEMDAASHTGVDDVRKIIEEVQYKPVVARYKIYIIDEVHMLSKSAFNALLKTLEEPPSHAKFIFATTEINKVPITILSRCQKFSLSRIEVSELTELFNDILDKESIKSDEESISIIARAAGGSARDGLSLLDQAISNSDGELSSEKTKEILGVSDKESILKIFEYMISGEVQESLKILNELYKKGADTFMILSDLMEYVHNIVKLRIIPEYKSNLHLTKTEADKVEELSRKIEISKLINLWQILTKGFDEMKSTDRNFQTLEMILVKGSYISSQPPLEKLIEKLENGELQIEAQKKNIANVETSSVSKLSEKEVVKNELPKVPSFIIDKEEPLKSLSKELKKDKELMLALEVEGNFILSSIEEVNDKLNISIGLKDPSKKSSFKSIKSYAEENYGTYINLVESVDGKTIVDEEKDNQSKVIEDVKKESAIVKSIFGAFGDLKVDKIEEN